jgi:sigma-B regulation protein RsbQ
VVVLSHGFGTDQTAWSVIRPWPDARLRVVSFDLAGAGPGGAASYDFRRHDTLFGYARAGVPGGRRPI